MIDKMLDGKLKSKMSIMYQRLIRSTIATSRDTTEDAD